MFSAQREREKILGLYNPHEEQTYYDPNIYLEPISARRLHHPTVPSSKHQTIQQGVSMSQTQKHKSPQSLKSAIAHTLIKHPLNAVNRPSQLSLEVNRSTPFLNTINHPSQPTCIKTINHSPQHRHTINHCPLTAKPSTHCLQPSMSSSHLPEPLKPINHPLQHTKPNDQAPTPLDSSCKPSQHLKTVNQPPQPLNSCQPYPSFRPSNPHRQTNPKTKVNKKPPQSALTSPPSLSCTSCNKTYVHRASLFKHMQKHHHDQSPGTGTVACQEEGCTFTCRYLAQLRKHLTVCHSISIESENITFQTMHGRSQLLFSISVQSCTAHTCTCFSCRLQSLEGAVRETYQFLVCAK